MAPGINSLTESLLSATTTTTTTRPPSTAVYDQSTRDLMPQAYPASSQAMNIDSLPSKVEPALPAVKEDTDSIQDILASSGINLKEEAEAITRDQDYLTSCLSSFPATEDTRSKVSSLFNVESLSFLISAIISKSKITITKNTEMNVMEALLLILQAKFASIVDELVLISRHRWESSSTKTIIRSKLYLLDKALAEQHRKERAEFDQAFSAVGGLFPAPRRGRIPNSVLQAAAAAAAALEEEDGVASPQAIASVGLQESSAVRARITNATAMGQLGIPMKQWMVNSPLSSSVTSEHRPDTRPPSLPLTSSFVPERRILMRDLLNVLTADPILSRTSTLYRAFLFFHSPLPTSG